MYQYYVTTYPRKINCGKKPEDEQQTSLYILKVVKIADLELYLLCQSVSHLHYDIFFSRWKKYIYY